MTIFSKPTIGGTWHHLMSVLIEAMEIKVEISI